MGEDVCGCDGGRSPRRRYGGLEVGKASSTPTSVLPRDRRDFPVFLLLALPNILLILAFVYRPLITNVYYSTLNWTLGSQFATPVASVTIASSSATRTRWTSSRQR